MYCLLFTLTLIHVLIKCHTKSVTLTPDQPSTNVANVTLVNSPGHNNVVTLNGTATRWQCNNSNQNSFCLYLTIKHLNCAQVETVDITLNGTSITRDNNMYAVFSSVNMDGTYDYFTFLHDWNNLSTTQVIDNSEYGSVFIAPNSNTLLNTDDIFNILNDIDTVNVTSSRLPFAGGDKDNWVRIRSSNTPVGKGTNPLYYGFKNDFVNNKIIGYFNSNTMPSTQYWSFNNDVFDTLNSGNDYMVFFLTDDGVVQFSQFDVDISCEVCILFSCYRIDYCYVFILLFFYFFFFCFFVANGSWTVILLRQRPQKKNVKLRFVEKC